MPLKLIGIKHLPRKHRKLALGLTMYFELLDGGQTLTTYLGKIAGLASTKIARSPYNSTKLLIKSGKGIS